MTTSNLQSAPPIGARPADSDPAGKLVQIDRLLRSGAHGFVRLEAPSSWLVALQRHVMRGCNRYGRETTIFAGISAGTAWYQLARQLHGEQQDLAAYQTSTDRPFPPAGVSTGVSRVNSRWAERVIVLLDYGNERAESAWLDELHDFMRAATTDRQSRVLFVLLASVAADPTAVDSGPAGSGPWRTDSKAHSERGGQSVAPDKPAIVKLPAVRPGEQERPGSQSVDVRLRISGLDASERLLWWQSLAFETNGQSSLSSLDLAELDSWWNQSRVEPAAVGPGRTMSEAGEQLLACLLDAGQPLPMAAVKACVDPSVVDELRQGRWIRRTQEGDVALADAVEARNWLALRPTSPAGLCPNELAHRKAVCAALLQKFGGDLWAWMRSAELYASSHALAAGEEQAFRAIDACASPTLRNDLWQRWYACLYVHETTPAQQAPSAHHEHIFQALLRASKKALGLGDSDMANKLVRQALRAGGETFAVLLLLGKTNRALDDLTTSTLVLARAARMPNEASRRAAAYASLAETRYAAGDLVAAKRHAEKAAVETSDQAVRLAARNVLGKLLLGQEQWDTAEQHYAADAFDAAAGGLLEHELRASLNRGIAIMSMGRRGEAERMYLEVLERGGASGNMRAVAFAYSNLATVAILEHRYAESLRYSTQAIETRRAIGERVQSMIVPVANLAQLRLRLGLYSEAKQVLRFGRTLLSSTSPASRGAYFAKAEALVSIELGDLAAARQQLVVLRTGAESLGGEYLLSQCERIAARLAIEEGDVLAAEQALLAARTYRHHNHGRAEVELLEAKWHRAAGAPFAESAAVAVRWAKKVDDIELLREAFLLLHHAHRNAGEARPAAQALAGALRQRQRMLDKLPDELRASYLERSPLKRLAEFEAGISGTGPSSGDVAPSTGAVRGTKSEPMRTRPNGGIGQLVGSSPTMVTLRAKIARVASTNATVLVHGPTGTGKELVAEAIHAQSQRSQGPLVKVNCAALVETLLLSELFGHEKGAFTGASTRRRGRFELAEGGTLFLDEIGDISERTQVALLRVLQDGTFERVGGCTSHRANVRVVCATHRDLEAMVERGEFRRDLYYRLCGILVAVPALKDHVSDVAELAEVFVRRTSAAAGVSAKPIQKQALAMLAQHPWPGNVRELENAVRVAALFATGQNIAWEDFRANVAGLSCLQPVERMPPVSSRASEQASDSSALVYEEVRAGLGLAAMKKKLERACIARALVDSGGNITRAAGLLGMKRPRLSQLVKQYELGKMLEELKSC